MGTGIEPQKALVVTGDYSKVLCYACGKALRFLQGFPSPSGGACVRVACADETNRVALSDFASGDDKTPSVWVTNPFSSSRSETLMMSDLPLVGSVWGLDVVPAGAGRSDSSMVISASGDGKAFCSDAKTGTSLFEFADAPKASLVAKAAVVRSGCLVGLGGEDGSVSLYYIFGGGKSRPVPGVQLEGHDGHVYGVDFDPSRQLAFTCSLDQTLMLWSTDSGDRLETVMLAERGNSLLAVPEKHLILAGLFGGSVAAFDTRKLSGRVSVGDIHSGDSGVYDMTMIAYPFFASVGDLDESVVLWSVLGGHLESMKPLDSVKTGGPNFGICFLDPSSSKGKQEESPARVPVAVPSVERPRSRSKMRGRAKGLFQISFAAPSDIGAQGYPGILPIEPIDFKSIDDLDDLISSSDDEILSTDDEAEVPEKVQPTDSNRTEKKKSTESDQLLRRADSVLLRRRREKLKSQFQLSRAKEKQLVRPKPFAEKEDIKTLSSSDEPDSSDSSEEVQEEKGPSEDEHRKAWLEMQRKKFLEKWNVVGESMTKEESPTTTHQDHRDPRMDSFKRRLREKEWRLEKEAVKRGIQLEDGLQAQVFVGELTLTNPLRQQHVAVKKRYGLQRRSLHAGVSRAVALKHDSLVRCYGCYSEDGDTWIVEELCELGTLPHFLKTTDVDRSTRLQILADVASGMAFLHANDITFDPLQPVRFRVVCISRFRESQDKVLVNKDHKAKIRDYIRFKSRQRVCASMAMPAGRAYDVESSSKGASESFRYFPPTSQKISFFAAATDRSRAYWEERLVEVNRLLRLKAGRIEGLSKKTGESSSALIGSLSAEAFVLRTLKGMYVEAKGLKIDPMIVKLGHGSEVSRMDALVGASLRRRKKAGPNIHSFGVLAYELLAEEVIYKQLVERFSSVDLAEKIHSAFRSGDFPDVTRTSSSQKLQDAIRRCWIADERPSFEELSEILTAEIQISGTKRKPATGSLADRMTSLVLKEKTRARPLPPDSSPLIPGAKGRSLAARMASIGMKESTTRASSKRGSLAARMASFRVKESKTRVQPPPDSSPVASERAKQKKGPGSGMLRASKSARAIRRARKPRLSVRMARFALSKKPVASASATRPAPASLQRPLAEEEGEEEGEEVQKTKESSVGVVGHVGTVPSEELPPLKRDGGSSLLARMRSLRTEVVATVEPSLAGSTPVTEVLETVEPSLGSSGSGSVCVGSSISSAVKSAPTASISASKEDDLFEFLRRGNLHRYYEDFLAQDVTELEDLKWLTEDDFAKIIPKRLFREKLIGRVDEELGGSSGLSSRPSLATPAGPAWQLDSKAVLIHRSVRALGSGSFGVVYRGTYSVQAGARGLKLPVAVKRIPLHQGSIDAIRKEVELMVELKHHNVVLAYGVYFDADFACIVTEYCANGSLTKHLERQKPSVADRLVLLAGIASGMSYLHQNGVFHRDLKPDNVVVTQDNVPKICDFGTAKHEGSLTGKTINIGTPRFIANRELFLTPASRDIYSFGIMAYEVLSDKIAFEDLAEEFSGIDLKDEIHKRGEFPDVEADIQDEAVSASVKEAVSACWSVAPEKQKSFAELVDILLSEAHKT